MFSLLGLFKQDCSVNIVWTFYLPKYGGDQDDKTWLYEHQHMPATGGKSYILILQDVKELAVSDEYKLVLNYFLKS